MPHIEIQCFSGRTDEQKKQMEEMKANRHHGHYGHHRHHGHHGHHPRMHKGNENFRGVELTEAQKTQFKAIDEKARKDFENILTSDQKKALEEAKTKAKRHHERHER